LTHPVGFQRDIEEALFYSPWPALPALPARIRIMPEAASGRGNVQGRFFSFSGADFVFLAERVTPSGIDAKGIDAK
jgi:hypothetical protein